MNMFSPQVAGFNSVLSFKEQFGLSGVVLDLRKAEVRNRHRIPFALEFDLLDDFHLVSYFGSLDREKVILILASERQHSKSVYRILKELGFRNTHQLKHHV